MHTSMLWPRRAWLVACALLFGAVAGCESSGELPPSMIPRVRAGAGVFEKDVFFEDKKFGTVSDIGYGDLEGDSTNKIVLAGWHGAVFLGEDGTTEKSLSLSSRHCDPGGHFKIARPVHGNRCLFLRCGLTTRPALFDHEGRMLWEHREGGVPLVRFTSP